MACNISNVHQYRIKVECCKEIDIMLPDEFPPFITGCTFMPDGQILLCDNRNKRLKVLHKVDNGLALGECLELQDEPWDIALIHSNCSDAVITIPKLKQIQVLQVEPRLQPGRVIEFDKFCWGVHVLGEELYVTSHYDPGNDEIRVLSMDGKLKKTTGMDQYGTILFRAPYYVTVSEATGKIFVSDNHTGIVTCLTSDGKYGYKYKDNDLKTPNGICVFDHETVLVCGQISRNAQLVSSDGTRIQTVLYSRNIARAPFSVAYMQSVNKLAIGCWDQRKLFVVTFKHSLK